MSEIILGIVIRGGAMADCDPEELVTEYRDALQAAKKAREEYLAMVYAVQSAGQAFRAHDVDKIVVEGDTVAFPRAGRNATDTPLITSSWPNAVKIARLVKNCQSAMEKARTLWQSIPSSERELLSEPAEMTARTLRPVVKV